MSCHCHNATCVIGRVWTMPLYFNQVVFQLAPAWVACMDSMGALTVQGMQHMYRSICCHVSAAQRQEYCVTASCHPH